MIRPQRAVKLLPLFVAVLLRAAPSSAAPEIGKSLPEGYLVLPFENASGVAGLEWMRAGLAVALAEKLEGHPALRPMYGALVLPDGAPPDAVNEETVVSAAVASGATFVWTGVVRRPAWELEVTLRLWRVGGGRATLVDAATERGDFATAFDMLSRLSLGLLAKADLRPPPAAEGKIQRSPTRDFYAFTLYGRGVAAAHGLGKPADLVKAEKDLSRCVFIDPKFAEAHRMLSVVYERMGQAAKARGQRSYALDLRPDYYAPLSGLVRIAYDAKERGEGIELAERALTIRPWDLDVRYLLGSMLWEEGNVDDAYTELARITAVRPDHLEARRILVLIHASKGASQDLARELEEITKLDPKDESAWIDLGVAYEALGRKDDAIRTYTGVAERNPKQLLALKFLGDMYKSRGELGKAIQFYEKALSANRSDPRPYFLLGAAYVDAGQDKKALRIYQQAQRFPRYLGDTYNNLGAIHYRRHDPVQALWYLSRAAAKLPGRPRVHYNYGLALSQTNQREPALKELTLASELDPTDADIQYAMGVTLLRIGRVEDAEKAFQECVKMAPKHADALFNLHLIDELRRRARDGEIKLE